MRYDTVYDTTYVILHAILCTIPHSIRAGCSDKHPECKEWAASGECRANPDWMLVNCQESCGLCGELNHTTC